MINESVNTKYLQLNAADVVTNHPLVFSRFIIKLLRKNGLTISDKKARDIQYSMYDPSMSGNKLTYNGAEFEISENQVDISFKFKLSGSEFLFTVKSMNFSFNTAKITLERLLFKINEKINFLFKGGISWSAIRQQQDQMDGDKDLVKSYQKIQSLDSYCEMLIDKFMFYNIRNEYRNKPQDTSIRIDISFNLQDFLDGIKEGLGRNAEWRSDIKHEFQKRDIMKIVKLLTSNIERLYGLYLAHMNISRSDVIIIYRGKKYIELDDIEKELKCDVPDDEMYQKIVTLLFQDI